MNSLQTFCSLRLVSWPFHSGEGALPSWGLGTLSVAAPAARGQRWCHGSTTASAQSRTPGPGAWGTNACRVPRQLLLGAVCQACLPWCANTHRGFHKNRTGLPRAASPVPAHPVVKLQQRGRDSIQAASNKGH